MVILYIFWIGVLVIFYTYLGYGMILSLLTRFKKIAIPPSIESDENLPPVTLVIAAYNEEKFILEKIQDCFNLDYPEHKINFFFVADGSTDNTTTILQRFPKIRVFYQPERKGKIHAVNRVMEFVETPITIFSDANAYLNAAAIKNLVRHYQDPAVGGVAGEKRIVKKVSDNASGSGEGLYWKYESFLKRKDAELFSVIGAAGELFSIRTQLFEKSDVDMIIEDFYLSLRIAARGYKFAYEPDAYATETASTTVEEEWKRKVRISAGAFQAMARLLYLLNPFRYGILSFQYFSHRVLRWTLAPMLLPLTFLANLVLAWKGLFLYQLIFALQVSFYLQAYLGYRFRDKLVSIKGFFVPYYFTVMNVAVFAGFRRYITGKQSVTWERAERAELKLK